METSKTYSIEELEADTGLSARTITYYVQEGLLPRIGRRGPKTRYPKSYRDRIRFIAEIRKLEEKGRIPSLTLSQIRDIFDGLTPEQIADVADGREALDAIVLSGEAKTLGDVNDELDALPLLAVSEGSLRQMSLPEVDEFDRKAVMSEVEPTRSVLARASMRRQAHNAPPSSAAEFEHMLDLLAEIQREATRDRHEGQFYHSQPWTRTRISSDLLLFARGNSEEMSRLLDRFAQFLKTEISKRSRGR